jgi:heptosyltransferase II
VRNHSVVKVLQAQMPERPVDVLTSHLCLPLVDYMDGIRQGIAGDLPHGRMAMGARWGLAQRLRREGYGSAIVMSRTWKAALIPFLAGIPVRTGFMGEMRLGLINDVRSGEKALPRMIERSLALALPPSAPLPDPIPLPELRVPEAERREFVQRNGLEREVGKAVALAPGAAAGPAKRWPVEYYAGLAGKLAADGIPVWVLGGPGEKAMAQQIAIASGTSASVRDLTGNDLRQAVRALACAGTAVSNDSGLLHVAAALGTPTIGIFGPTSPWHWGPLNPLAAAVETRVELPCRPCHQPVCPLGHHLCMRTIEPDEVVWRSAALSVRSRP